MEFHFGRQQDGPEVDAVSVNKKNLSMSLLGVWSSSFLCYILQPVIYLHIAVPSSTLIFLGQFEASTRSLNWK